MVVKSAIKEKLNSPEKVASVFADILSLEAEFDREKEHFWVAGLRSNNAIKYIDLVSLGTVNSALVHPREVFRMAIHQGVTSILICHNHPSGEPYPSPEDEAITKKLIESGKILDIQVLDHVIIGNNEYYSFKEKGNLF